MIYRLEDTAPAAALFAGSDDTFIDSCLNGIMGSLYAPSLSAPQSAAAEVCVFRLFAGRPDEELVLLPRHEKLTILIPRDEAWAQLIEKCFPSSAKRVTRYAIKKDAVFSAARLKELSHAAGDGYVFSEIDGELYDACLAEEWSADFVLSYSSKQEFLEKGLGILALKDGEIVAGASSYCTFSRGIEVEVDTRPDFRLRRLATACSARLILACLERGLYPSWDAMNPESLHLAEKLGYEFAHEYTAYMLYG